jgi:hypothetical protein
MCELNQHFDFVIESCQTGMIKPEPQLYKFVLDTVKASPSEVYGCLLSGERLSQTHCHQKTEEPGQTVLGLFL